MRERLKVALIKEEVPLKEKIVCPQQISAFTLLRSVINRDKYLDGLVCAATLPIPGGHILKVIIRIWRGSLKLTSAAPPGESAY